MMRSVVVVLALVGAASAQPVAPSGHYSGVWNNLTFASSGGIKADGVNSGGVVTMTIDPAGGVFGLGDPAPFVLTGPLTSSGWTASLTDHALLGDMTVSVTSGGAVTINGSDVPGSIDTYSATGTFSAAGVLSLTGIVNFEGGGSANTTITCSRTAFSTLVSGAQVANGQFGNSVAGIGDVTGDGKGDIVVGAPGDAAAAGRVYIINGVSNAVYRTLVSPGAEAGGHFGQSVAAVPDVNGDGFPDVAVGAPDEDPGTAPESCGRAYIFSGRTGALLWKLLPPAAELNGHFGWCVTGIADISGDARGDVAVGAPAEDPGAAPDSAGRVHIYNGATGARIRTLAPGGLLAGDFFGFSVAGVPDVNGDSRGDLVVGMPQGYLGTMTGRPGKAMLFSGASGVLLRVLNSPGAEADGRFGTSVGGIPDVNGDARGDVVVGAPNEDPGTNPDATGRAHVYNGATGGLLWKLMPPTPTLNGRFGYSVSGMGDTNGDGRGDIVVGAPGEGVGSPGFAYIYSGINGARLLTIGSRYPEGLGAFGISVSGVPTVNGGAAADVVVGAWQEDPGTAPANAGRAYLLRR